MVGRNNRTETYRILKSHVLPTIALIAIVLLLFFWPTEADQKPQWLTAIHEVALLVLGAYVGFVLGGIRIDRSERVRRAKDLEGSGMRLHHIADEANRLARETRTLGTSQNSRLRFRAVSMQIDQVGRSVRIEIASIEKFGNVRLPRPAEVADQVAPVSVPCPTNGVDIHFEMVIAADVVVPIQCSSCGDIHRIRRSLGVARVVQ